MFGTELLGSLKSWLGAPLQPVVRKLCGVYGPLQAWGDEVQVWDTYMAGAQKVSMSALMVAGGTVASQGSLGE